MAKRTVTKPAPRRQRAAKKPAEPATTPALEDMGQAYLEARKAAERHGVDVSDLSQRVMVVATMKGRADAAALDALAKNQAADFRAFAKGLEEPERPAFRLDRVAVWDGPDTIQENAPLLDVVAHLFADSGDEAFPSSITRPVLRSVIDDLALVEAAAEHEVDLSVELPRIIERIRSRLVIAQWLDSKIERAVVR